LKNSRYTVALHILTALTIRQEYAITSEQIADSVNTNPVVIRRLLATLRQAGLVSSQSGVGGGITLNQPAENITLLDVYRLFQDDVLFPMHTNPPNATCTCGANIQTVLGSIYDEAEKNMESVLAGKTVADLAVGVWQAHQVKQ